MDKNIENSKQEDKCIEYFGGLLKLQCEIVWPSVSFLLFTHLCGVYGLWLCLNEIIHLRLLTVSWMYFYGCFAGLFGICIGAHRYWAHRSFKATTPLKILLIVANSVAGQNSCYAWIRDHRLHHKFSDTDADPHNVTRGFFFSHIGWLMVKKHRDISKKGKTISMADIDDDAVVMFQKRHFKLMFLIFGVIIPVYVPCYLWQETVWNSVFISLFLRYIILLHITWAINSFAHTFGYRPYDNTVKPAENAIVSFFAHGEGWHNYHHTFPWDYKASDYGVNFNAAKYVIEFFEKIGWAYDLKKASDDVVEKRMQRTGDGTCNKIKKI